MAKVYANMLELVGKTPLVRAERVEQALGLEAKILLKLESYNPLRSVKDRAALAMIEDAEERGLLSAGSTIVEASSGNTGIGLAFVGRLKGYRVVIVMPESMSLERRSLITALGAELVLTPASGGMKAAIAEAEAILSRTEGAVILGQFDNPANPRKHELTTGAEILADTEGDVDYFISGVGTGGTVTGVGRALKASKPATRIVAVQPELSQVLTGGSHSPHMLQGIGAGFVPQNYDASVVDEVLNVSNDEAIEAARLLAANEGLLGGFSSGAALSAAIAVARRPEAKGKTIVVLLPDTGERYLSTVLYGEASK